jgi:hypothetical protein
MPWLYAVPNNRNQNEWESDFAVAVAVRDGQLSHWRILCDMGLEGKAITG